jgi:hypothetical protein
MGAIETLQGSEYGLPTRALCCEALARAGSPQAFEIRERARAYVSRLVEHIRDPIFRELFLKRRVVLDILQSSPAPTKSPEHSLFP